MADGGLFILKTRWPRSSSLQGLKVEIGVERLSDAVDLHRHASYPKECVLDAVGYLRNWG